MPFKLSQNRRYYIPKQKHEVINWREYDASLRKRGSLTVWFTAEAIEAWRAAPRTTPGGQRWYPPLAILTALTLRAVFRLALRQTAGLIGSVIGPLGLTLAVPDHTTLCRRAETLEVPRPRPLRTSEPLHLLVDSTGLKLCSSGEWLVEKRGTRTRSPSASPNLRTGLGQLRPHPRSMQQGYLRIRYYEINRQHLQREQELRLLQDLDAFCDDIRDKLTDPLLETRRSVLRLVIDQVIVGGERLVIRNVVPIASVGLQPHSRRAGFGASCTSAWTPTPARLSQQR